MLNSGPTRASASTTGREHRQPRRVRGVASRCTLRPPGASRAPMCRANARTSGDRVHEMIAAVAMTSRDVRKSGDPQAVAIRVTQSAARPICRRVMGQAPRRIGHRAASIGAAGGARAATPRSLPCPTRVPARTGPHRRLRTAVRSGSGDRRTRRRAARRPREGQPRRSSASVPSPRRVRNATCASR